MIITSTYTSDVLFPSSVCLDGVAITEGSSSPCLYTFPLCSTRIPHFHLSSFSFPLRHSLWSLIHIFFSASFDLISVYSGNGKFITPSLNYSQGVVLFAGPQEQVITQHGTSILVPSPLAPQRNGRTADTNVLLRVLGCNTQSQIKFWGPLG